MKKNLLAASIAAVIAPLTLPAVADEGVFEEVIRVTGVREPSSDSIDVLREPGPLAPDIAQLIARMPGAALIDNGSLSGQLQYRGVFGERLAVSINGQRFHSGGPNMMDPPLSYAPSVLVERIDVSRGAPGTEIASSLMGGLDVVLKSVAYTTSDAWMPQYDLTLTARDNDRSHGVGGVVGVANDSFRVFGLFSDEQGDDASWDGGDIRGTSFDRRLAGAGFGWRADNSYIDVELRRQETGPTGNPPFAMDIEYIDTDFSRVAFGTRTGEWAVSGLVSLSDVDHGMNNYGLRPAPANPMMYRRTLTGARTLFASLSAARDFTEGRLEIGVDVDQADKSALITNPNNAGFFIGTLNDVDVGRAGLWASWTGELGALRMKLGGRVDRHEASAGEAFTGPMVPAMPVMLASAFNQQDRTWDDVTGDASLRVWWAAGDMTWRASLSRKSRAPGYVERFSWLPTPASGGLADGNTWIGQLGLNAEVANTVDFGFDLRGDRLSLRPTAFYSRVNDFVQGLPVDTTPDVVDSLVEMISAMNGDPSPLRFSNVDARLYGLEMDMSLRMTSRLVADANWTWVRGDRLDVDEPLYRVTPSRLTAGLGWFDTRYDLRVEAVHEAAQDRVSAINIEATTPSNTIVNLHGSWHVTRNIDVALGMQNVFDADYQRHLAGYNRHADSDVALGERLPGQGRTVYLRLNAKMGPR